MAYSNYSPADFATDSFFRQWVFQPTPESESFWTEFLREHPHQAKNLQQAKRLVQQLQQATTPSNDEAASVEVIWQSLQTRLDAPVEVVETPVIRLWPRWGRWAAASVILLIGLAGWAWLLVGSDQARVADESSRTATNVDREAVNQTANPMLVSLPDGSRATLQPRSRLQYPAQFAGSRRQVELQGEAFFEVTKNPARPFLVYAGETVTKVVGTSFRIRAFEQEQTVRVIVRTGRVMVFARKHYEPTTTTTMATQQGVVLTPNQRATFDRSKEQLAKDLVEKPLPLPTIPQPRELVFEDRPVSEVLITLERLYGLEIVYDEEVLSHCLITTTLLDEGLHQRLTRICRAIGATYDVIDGQIIINNSGCTH